MSRCPYCDPPCPRCEEVRRDRDELAEREMRAIGERIRDYEEAWTRLHTSSKALGELDANSTDRGARVADLDDALRHYHRTLQRLADLERYGDE
jgi:hypothetical protein